MGVLVTESGLSLVVGRARSISGRVAGHGASSSSGGARDRL
jgi:hypothetical protein